MCVLKKRAAARLAAALPVVALLVTLGVSTARADGYVISQPTPSSPIMAGQRAALIYRDGHEDLVISISLDFRPVQQRPDIAWIIPVPSLPEFRATGNALFDELDRLSAPEIVLPPEGQGALAPGTSAPAPTSTVEVLERTQVGVYDLSVLASRNGGALRDWLNAEGLAIPGALQPTVDAYIAEQWVFVAMRIATDADQAEASSTPPVWLSFDAPQMV